ncbi:MAG TPA: SbcC/MukB-like Walker B domain-containing protein, partial [Marmoricola sp.]|nr:SbcC/MukB-like Walker B domain-containing protein [Marmoricola sp.]
GPDWPVWTELQPGQVGPSLDRMLLQVNEFAAETLAEVDAAESAVEATTEAAEQSRRVADLRGVGLAARDRLTALAEMAPAIAEQRDRLDRAERSRAVAGHLAAADRAAAELFRLDEELAAAESSARATCRAGTLPAAVTAEDARAIADAVREHDALLTGARDAGSRVARLRGQQRAAEQRLGELEQRATDLASAQQEHATRREELTAQLDSLAATAAARAPREQDVTQLERAAHLVEQVAADEGRMPQLTSHLEACREAWRAAEKHVLSLRTARLEGVAGELAEKLVDGEDCPVCGSGEHPRPAQRSEGDLDTSHAAIDAAQEAAEEARAQQDKASAAVTSAEAALAARREELDSCLAGIDRNEPLSQDSVPVRLDEARVALAGARAAEQQLPQVRDRLQELTAAAETATAEVTGLRESRAGTRSQLEQAREDEATEHATVERLLGAHGGGCPCGAGRDNGQEPGQTAATAELQVAEVVAAHERAWRRLDRLATVLRDRESAAMRRDDALSERDRALAERGFAAVEDARAAQLPVAQVDEIARQLAEVDRTRAAAEADLDKPDVQQALTAQEPDLPALELQVREARGRLKTAGQTHTHLELAIQRLTDLAAALERTVDALGPAEAEHDLLAELAECVAGTSQDNTLRMRLSSYVLAARLEEVARYANERLAVMSDGRYSLQHSDARAARGARGGLGLTVTDAWTGVARETASLSGGESFMAALALALGLGDAVRAEAGGLDLQTLFIDEGFGSLDEDSLEQVMGVLDDLREGGRCVGIVSHVAELRQQIRAQVLVTKTTAGSHVEVTCRPDRETAA